jgi:ferredoxin
MPIVRFAPSGRQVEVQRGTLVMDAVRAAGLPIARACGDDLICARCGVRVLAGTVARESAVERESKRRNRIAPELRLACAIRVKGDLELGADYWGAPRGLVLVDHGSRAPEARAHAERLADRVRARAPGWLVRAAHMEQCAPSVEDAVAECARAGATEVAVVPLFVAPGKHLARDVPALVAAAAAAHPGLRVWQATALGEASGLAGLIVELAEGRA